MRHRILSLTRAMTRRFTWVDAAAVLVIGFLVHGLIGVASEWRAPLRPTVEIDLSLSALPGYTFFSLCRGLVAIAFSLLFTLGYGWVAARVRGADRVMLPLLDILQSIPVLGFMPGLVLALVTLVPRSNAGLELASVLMIFTGQVWNMTFSFYHSLRSIPPELVEASRVYGFSAWRRFRKVELPASKVGLAWIGMVAAAVMMGRAWWNLAPEVFGGRMPLVAFVLLVFFVAWVWLWFAIVLVKCEGSVRSCGPWRLALDVGALAMWATLAWVVWWRTRRWIVAAFILLGNVGARLPIYVPDLPPWIRPIGIIMLSVGLVLALVALFSSAEKHRPEPGTHTFFAAGWFRVVIAVAALGTLLILSVPYLLSRLAP